MKGQTEKATTAQELGELRAAIDHLSDRIHVLTQAVDVLSDEVGWRNNQLRDDFAPAPVMPLTSMPADPLSEDWELNRVRAEDLPAELQVPGKNVQREGLFD